LESGLFDLPREDWDERLLGFATIDRTWLGPVRFPSDLVGRLTPEAARMTGLAAGTPVAAGSADHVASAFAAGLTEEGDLLVKLGGAGDILYCVDRPAVDPRLYLDYHLVPGKFLINGCMATSGSLIRWFRDEFAPGMDYGALDAEAANLDAGDCSSDGRAPRPTQRGVVQTKRGCHVGLGWAVLVLQNGFNAAEHAHDGRFDSKRLASNIDLSQRRQRLRTCVEGRRHLI